MRKTKLIIIFSIVCILTLLVVINSVLFAIANIEAYYYASDDDTFDQVVLDACTIKSGSSILFINEQEIIDEMNQNLIDSGYPNVYINTVERAFPNTNYIHYELRTVYYYVIYSGNTYFYSYDGVLLEISEGTDCDKQGALEFITSANLKSLNLGDIFETDEVDDVVQVANVVSSMRNYLLFSDIATTFVNVDIAGTEYNYLTVRGAMINIDSDESFNDKFQLAYSVYKERLTSSVASEVASTTSGTFYADTNTTGVYVYHSSEVQSI